MDLTEGRIGTRRWTGSCGSCGFTISDLVNIRGEDGVETGGTLCACGTVHGTGQSVALPTTILERETGERCPCGTTLDENSTVSIAGAEDLVACFVCGRVHSLAEATDKPYREPMDGGRIFLGGVPY